MSVFHTDPVVTPSDYERLLPHLTSWGVLNEILLLDEIETDDLKRLVLIEKDLHQRDQILTKLISKIYKREQLASMQAVGLSE